MQLSPTLVPRCPGPQFFTPRTRPRNLVQADRDSSVQQSDKNFRFQAEKVGNTLFLMRMENGGPMEIIDDIVGYGHAFPKAYTTWDAGCEGSESHQRLITYNLGDLKCIVRYEADGYLPGKLDEDHPLKHVGDL
jgi:hypothetical protein